MVTGKVPAVDPQPKGDVVQVLIYAAGALWLLVTVPVRAFVAGLRRVELAGAAV